MHVIKKAQNGMQNGENQFVVRSIG